MRETFIIGRRSIMDFQTILKELKKSGLYTEIGDPFIISEEIELSDFGKLDRLG